MPSIKARNASDNHMYPTLMWFCRYYMLYQALKAPAIAHYKGLTMIEFLLGLGVATAVFLLLIWYAYNQYLAPYLYCLRIPHSGFNNQVAHISNKTKYIQSPLSHLPKNASTLTSLRSLGNHGQAIAILENGKLIFDGEIIDIRNIGKEIEELMMKVYLELDAASNALSDLAIKHYSMRELAKSDHEILVKISGMSHHYPMEWTIRDVANYLGIDPYKNDTGSIGGQALWKKVCEWQNNSCR